MDRSFYSLLTDRLLGAPQDLGGMLPSVEQEAARRNARMAMAASLLQSSGPSEQKRSTLQNIGAGIMAGRQANAESGDAAMRKAFMAAQIQAMLAKQNVEPKRYVVNGALVDEEGRPLYTAPGQSEPPESRTINRGGQTITQEWDPVAKSWTDIAQSPRWEPNSSGGRMQPPAGYRFQPDGSLQFIPGGPADPSAKPKEPPKPTEADKKAGVLIRGMQDAEQQIASASKQTDPTGKWNAVMGSIPLTGGVFQSDDYRSYKAAAERWAANYLYLKSGAQAGQDEIQSTVRQFFPQSGEDDRIVKQKELARQQEMESAMAVYGGGAQIGAVEVGQTTTINGAKVRRVR
jgi:hypothetical protein